MDDVRAKSRKRGAAGGHHDENAAHRAAAAAMVLTPPTKSSRLQDRGVEAAAAVAATAEAATTAATTPTLTTSRRNKEGVYNVLHGDMHRDAFDDATVSYTDNGGLPTPTRIGGGAAGNSSQVATPTRTSDPQRVPLVFVGSTPMESDGTDAAANRVHVPLSRVTSITDAAVATAVATAGSSGSGKNQRRSTTTVTSNDPILLNSSGRGDTSRSKNLSSYDSSSNSSGLVPSEVKMAPHHESVDDSARGSICNERHRNSLPVNLIRKLSAGLSIHHVETTVATPPAASAASASPPPSLPVSVHHRICDFLPYRRGVVAAYSAVCVEWRDAVCGLVAADTADTVATAAETVVAAASGEAAASRVADDGAGRGDYRRVRTRVNLHNVSSFPFSARFDAQHAAEAEAAWTRQNAQWDVDAAKWDVEGA
jgi:hypothetical protein